MNFVWVLITIILIRSLFGRQIECFDLSVSGESDQKAIVMLYSFEKFLKTSAAHSDFVILPSVSGDRVHKRRIPVIHNVSGIRCFIQFDSSFELAETSQCIQDCILHEPICKPHKIK